MKIETYLLFALFQFQTFLQRSTKLDGYNEGYNFTGIPLIIAGTKLFDCQHGKDRKLLAKEKKKKGKDRKKARNYTN